MKYQKGLKETKTFLKNSPLPKIKEVCENAGLTNKETEIIVQKFRKGKDRLSMSCELGKCESSLSIATTRILNILKSTLQELGFIDK